MLIGTAPATSSAQAPASVEPAEPQSPPNAERGPRLYFEVGAFVRHRAQDGSGMALAEVGVLHEGRASKWSFGAGVGVLGFSGVHGYTINARLRRRLGGRWAMRGSGTLLASCDLCGGALVSLAIEHRYISLEAGASLLSYEDFPGYVDDESALFGGVRVHGKAANIVAGVGVALLFLYAAGL